MLIANVTGKRFQKNLVQAVEMEASQSKNFEEYDSRFKNNRDLVEEWTAAVTAYETDPANHPNPYVEAENTSMSSSSSTATVILMACSTLVSAGPT